MSGWILSVPAAAYLVMAFAIRRRLGAWRVSLLAAAVGWGVALTVMTEVLSHVHRLTWRGLVAAWLTVLAGAALLACLDAPNPFAVRKVRSLDVESKALIVATALVALTVGLVACVAPPNTFDSMTYHMSRVAHWVQNASVEPYPTKIQRQLYQSPGAEFVILHLQILSRGDRLANLVQWLSMVGTLLATSVVARELGGGRAAQCLSALFVATIPMGVLQASGTQNDYVAAFWISAMLATAMASDGQRPSCRCWLVIAAGGALGLAILTKPTAYLFAAPFALFIAAWPRPRLGWRRLGLALAAAGVVAGAVNVGHYSRNMAVYGSPLGPRADDGYTYSAERFAPASVVSTAVRNLTLHLATPSQWLNERIERAVRGAHLIMGVDPDDPHVTWRGQRFAVTRWRPHEDFAGNPVHVVLLIGAAVFFVAARRRRDRAVLAYAGALLAAWLLFSAALKWQPWNSRLHLALFVLGAPLVAIAVTDRPRVRMALAAVLIIGALPALLWNESRPLVGSTGILRRDRGELYFSNAPGQLPRYANVVRVLRALNCRRVGLAGGGGEIFEYPLWVLMEPFGRPDLRIEHVGEDARPGGSRRPFTPCAIVGWQHGDTLAVDGALHVRIWGSTEIGVYVPVDRVSPSARPWPLLERLIQTRDSARRSTADDRTVHVALETDGLVFASGRRLQLRVNVQLSPKAPSVGLYAGVLLPDGLHVMLFRAPKVPASPVRISALRELFPLTPPPTGLEGQIILFDAPDSSALPAGECRVFAALATPPRSRSPDDGEFLAADVRSIRLVR